MSIVSHRCLGRVYVLIIVFCAVFLAMQAGRHSPWYKQRLFRQLVSGSAEEQLYAASALAQLGAEDHLLAGLKADRPAARDLARRGLEYLWFHAAGKEAYELLSAAYQASETAAYDKALSLLGELIRKFPRFAEGWNQRAAVYWELGEYAKSRADCEKALALNPHHFGAWQGIGLCQLQMGDVAGACRSLRAALDILPYDDDTQQSLRRCEELLQVPSPDRVDIQDGELI